MKHKFPFIKINAVLVLTCAFPAAGLQAQLLNPDQIKVSPGTVVSVYADFKNGSTGEFINDGQVYFFHHFTNDGKVGFTVSQQGTSYFSGEQEQIIDGELPSASVYSRFKNMVFNNNSTLSPFLLAADISVSGSLNFQSGIIDAESYNGRVIFEADGVHANAGDKSFVDGRVTKIGTAPFEYPVGDGGYYRPSLHGASDNSQDSYTSRYFLKNSNASYPHSSREDKIKSIDDRQYWEIQKESGLTNIVLTLTLDRAVTPEYIYDQAAGTEIHIVRWDASAGKWISQGGVADEAQSMVTSQVTGYGIFALARVVKSEEDEDDLTVHNALSPNGDGKNDYFLIQGIDKYPDNTVEIYNRWGVLVYHASGYNESDRVFRGLSSGRATVSRDAGLPSGTYFYILKYRANTGNRQKAGYLYINQND